jgi:hypothetical protein
MEIEYSLDKKDLMALAQHQIDHSPVMKRRGQNRRWIYPFGFSLMAAGTYMIYREMILPIFFIALSIFSYIFFPIYYKWLVQTRVGRIVSEQMKPSSLAPRKLSATPEGLEQVMESAESKIKWSLIDRIDTTPAHTFISIEGTYLIIIPNDKFETKTYEEFVTSIRKYCQPFVS